MMKDKWNEERERGERMKRVRKLNHSFRMRELRERERESISQFVLESASGHGNWMFRCH